MLAGIGRLLFAAIAGLLRRQSSSQRSETDYQRTVGQSSRRSATQPRERGHLAVGGMFPHNHCTFIQNYKYKHCNCTEKRAAGPSSLGRMLPPRHLTNPLYVFCSEQTGRLKLHYSPVAAAFLGFCASVSGVVDHSRMFSTILW